MSAVRPIRRPAVTVTGGQTGGLMAFGGAFEGAERLTRETVNWTPSRRSADQEISPVKLLADARGRDMFRNEGHIAGAVRTHQDSVVGGYYRLNADPDYEALGADAGWAEEFQTEIERQFHLISESLSHWLDAARTSTFTGLVRLGVGGFLTTGEICAAVKWMNRDASRPLKTAIQVISPDRLSNPNDMPDTFNLRRGVKRDNDGRPISYFVRQSHPTEFWDSKSFSWEEIQVEKPWGRRQFIHVMEPMFPDQTRGIAAMVSVLKQMHMTKNFEEVTLQNAVVNATYAASIESELPAEVLNLAMGGPSATDPMTGFMNALGGYTGAIDDYYSQAKAIQIDGVKIPHFFPGTKLNMKPLGSPGGVGYDDFNSSLLRHTAAALGLSYEEFARDYSKTSYSSARASMAQTFRYMQSQKKIVADRFANEIYTLVVEELWNGGLLPVYPGWTVSKFYDRLAKEAFCRAQWTGAARGQIDELKETQAQVMKQAAGHTTLEAIVAESGQDWRLVIKQLAREKKLLEKEGITLDLASKRPSASTTVGAEESDIGQD